MLQLLRDLRRYHHALLTLLTVNVKTTVASARLGWLWWFIDPLVMMAIYYFIIRVVFQRGGENYHLFVLCGIVTWQFFARSLTASVTTITKNRGIIRQTSTPIGLLIAVPCAVQLFFAAVGTLMVMLWSYPTLGWQSLAVLPLLLLLFLLVYAVSLFAAVTQVFFADTSKLLGYLIRAGFFLSPVLYPVSRISEAENIPQAAKWLFELNPIGWLIEAFRGVIIEGVAVDWLLYGVQFVLVLLLLQLGLSYLRLCSNRIVKML